MSDWNRQTTAYVDAANVIGRGLDGVAEALNRIADVMSGEAKPREMPVPGEYRCGHPGCAGHMRPDVKCC